MMMKDKVEQLGLSIFGTNKFPTYEEIIEEYAKEWQI